MHKKWKDPVNSEIETTKYNTEPFSISVLLNMDQILSHRGVYFICADSMLPLSQNEMSCNNVHNNN